MLEKVSFYKTTEIPPPLEIQIIRWIVITVGYVEENWKRAKWSLSGGPVACPECHRSFANAGRLERHLLGFHTQSESFSYI